MQLNPSRNKWFNSAEDSRVKIKVSLVLDDEVKGAITQEVLSTGSDDAERILDLRLGRHLDDPSVVSQLKKRGKLIFNSS